VSGERLNIVLAAAGFEAVLGRLGDDGAPAGMRRGAGEPERAVEIAEPLRHGPGPHRGAVFRADDAGQRYWRRFGLEVDPRGPQVVVERDRPATPLAFGRAIAQLQCIADRPVRGPHHAQAIEDRLEPIKWKLWHGDAREALRRIEDLADDLDALESDYPNRARFAKAAAEFAGYIRNNLAIIPNYGERRRYGEPISTAFVESTVNVVVDKRFAKKQQMQWSKVGAHRLVQIRTRTLDGTLRKTFAEWYPAMAANDSPIPAAADAA
jgi:hypothetical protein